MKVMLHKSSIRKVDSNHPAFKITDGLILTSRAGFEINEKCPREYKQVISACIDRGWLKPVAYMTEKELTLYGLSK